MSLSSYERMTIVNYQLPGYKRVYALSNIYLMKSKAPTKQKKKDEGIIPFHDAVIPEPLEGELRTIQEGSPFELFRMQCPASNLSALPVRPRHLRGLQREAGDHQVPRELPRALREGSVRWSAEAGGRPRSAGWTPV